MSLYVLELVENTFLVGKSKKLIYLFKNCRKYFNSFRDSRKLI
jgi:hypothetical protein